MTYLALELNGHIKVRDEELGFSTSFGSHQCFFSQFCYATKPRSIPRQFLT